MPKSFQQQMQELSAELEDVKAAVRLQNTVFTKQDEITHSAMDAIRELTIKLKEAQRQNEELRGFIRLIAEHIGAAAILAGINENTPIQ